METRRIQSLRRYLSLLLQFRRRSFVLAGICMMLSSVLSGMGIMLLVPLLNVLGANQPESDIGFLNWVGANMSAGMLLLTCASLFAVNALVQRWVNLTNARVTRSFSQTLEKRVYAAIMKADWMYIQQCRRSDLTYALTENVQVVSAATNQLLQLCGGVVLAVVHGGLSLAISPGLSLLLLGSFILFWLLARRIDAGAKVSGRELVDFKKQFYGDLSNHLDGMKESRSFGGEERQMESFNATVDHIHEAFLSFRRTAEDSALLHRVLSVVTLCSVVFVASELLQASMVSLGLLVVIAGRLLPRLKAVHTGVVQVRHMLPAFDSLIQLINECEESRPELAAATNHPQPLTLTRKLEIRDLSFAYSSSADLALRDANICIPAGKVTAVVGASGSGKTTLMDLLLGLMFPQQGTIHVDDIPLEAWNAQTWRQSIGYVPQESFLMHDTLRANMQLAKADATDDEIYAAVEQAMAAEFVRQLPDGLDTIVGNRGTRFSGGERQRIALARALLKTPQLLILDEATSALDGHNQQAVFDGIEKLSDSMTVVVVAHRLSSVRHADQIVVLDAGAVVEVGSWDELSGAEDGQFLFMLMADGSIAA